MLAVPRAGAHNTANAPQPLREQPQQQQQRQQLQHRRPDHHPHTATGLATPFARGGGGGGGGGGGAGAGGGDTVDPALAEALATAPTHEDNIQRQVRLGMTLKDWVRRSSAQEAAGIAVRLSSALFLQAGVVAIWA